MTTFRRNPKSCLVSLPRSKVTPSTVMSSWAPPKCMWMEGFFNMYNSMMKFDVIQYHVVLSLFGDILGEEVLALEHR